MNRNGRCGVPNDTNDPSPETLGRQFAEMAEELRSTELGGVTPAQIDELQRLLGEVETIMGPLSEDSARPQGGGPPAGN